MAKFFVGQRVRVVRAINQANIGKTARITHFGHWVRGDILPNGGMLRYTVHGHSNVFLMKDDGESTPSHTDNLEPIQPSGHCAGDYSYRELMDSLKVPA